MLFGWTLIFLGTIYEAETQDYFGAGRSGTTFIIKLRRFIGEWSATLIMTFVNYLIPWVLSFVGKLEQWDFAAEALRAELLKNFYTSSLNVVFFMGLQVSSRVLHRPTPYTQDEG